MGERIGLFGGSFNPIHHGHLILARSLHEQLNLQKTIVLPSGQPPQKAGVHLAPAPHRAEMVRLAIAGEGAFAFDDFDLTRQGLCYTIETVRHFASRFPESELFWFVGADSLMDLPTWRESNALVRMCTIVTAARTGQPIDSAVLERAFGPDQARKLVANIRPTPLLDISSTEIRRRVANALSIRYLVPETVREYIERHDLYRDRADGRPSGSEDSFRVC